MAEGQGGVTARPAASIDPLELGNIMNVQHRCMPAAMEIAQNAYLHMASKLDNANTSGWQLQAGRHLMQMCMVIYQS